MTLTKKEMAALVAFWNRYMPARKHYEQLLKDHQEGGKLCGCSEWLAYNDTKQLCYRILSEQLPEVKYYMMVSGEQGTGFWRDVTMLRPQAVVDGVLRYRKEKLAEREQREQEKAILAGMKEASEAVAAAMAKPAKRVKKQKKNRKQYIRG